MVALGAFVLLSACESVAGVWHDKGLVGGAAGAPSGGASGNGGSSSGAAGSTGNTGGSGGKGGTENEGGNGGDAGMSGAAGNDDSGGAAGHAGNTNPSCEGLSRTCGALGNDDCCTSVSLPGGTFDRLHDVKFPATVSAFAIDKYEVTVGRFQRFANLPHSAWVPKNGDGKNPNDPKDKGWETAWRYNTILPDSPAAEVTACWNDASVWIEKPLTDNKALNCISWYLAFAFCVWDGGRLPTEAEWDYAARHGTGELYPWGNNPPENNWNLAVWNCQGCNSSDPHQGIQVVGSAPAGNAKWPTGEIADLAGNVGEWLRDTYVDSNNLPMPCTDCMNFVDNFADLDVPLRGGSYRENVSIDERNHLGATGPRGWIGFRCVRTP